jgi:hypothetical protein
MSKFVVGGVFTCQGTNREREATKTKDGGAVGKSSAKRAKAFDFDMIVNASMARAPVVIQVVSISLPSR